MFDWLRSRLGPRENGDLLRQAGEALRSGAPGQAREICLGVLTRSPDDAHALSLMANIAADERQVEEGLRWAGKAIASDPSIPLAHYSMARLWEQAGRADRAESSYRRVLELDPAHARAHNNLGCLLNVQGRRAEALECFRRALKIDPQQAEANQNYAAMTGDPSAQEAALQGYARQTEADPTDARAFSNLGNLYAGLGRNREALASLERAIALEPERADARYSRALLLLAQGDYATGWREYAWRWRLGNAYSAPAHRFPAPFWDGSSARDQAVFLHGEAAFGESLQFVRYAPLVARRCGRVIFECAPQLKSLLEHAPGVSEIAVTGAAAPRFDAHLPIFELPRLFGTTLDNIPWDGPYLSAAPERIAKWGPLLARAGKGGLKVGLVWTGNPVNPNNLDRSIPPEALRPLLDLSGVSLYSLQVGGADPRLPLIDVTAGIGDFSDTAAILHHLDLVVSIDTAVAHLAGAMGRPVWAMLNLVPDWRYHVGRSDNPWYPSMTLYRQAREADWAPVVAAIATGLRRLAPKA